MAGPGVGSRGWVCGWDEAVTQPVLRLILDPTKSDLTDAAPDAAAPEFPPEEQRRLVAEDWKRFSLV